jgi:hypothetical protein
VLGCFLEQLGKLQPVRALEDEFAQVEDDDGEHREVSRRRQRRGGILLARASNYKKLSAANCKRPRIANTRANRALVDRLKALGIASSDTEANGEIKVNMKQG